MGGGREAVRTETEYGVRLPPSGKVAHTRVLREHTGKAKSPCGNQGHCSSVPIDGRLPQNRKPRSTTSHHGCLTACFHRGPVVSRSNVPAARYFSNWQALNRVCRRRDIGFGMEWSPSVGMERQNPRTNVHFGLFPRC